MFGQTPSENLAQESSTLPKARNRGFNDPEIRKKATEKSLAVRRGGENQEEGLIDYAQGSSEVATFQPTKAMLMVLKAALDPEVGHSRNSWFEAAGLSRNNWQHWQKLPGFTHWWNKAIQIGLEQFKSVWLLIGMKKMGKEHKYWADMGDRIFGFEKKIKVEESISELDRQVTQEILEFFKTQNKKENEKVINVVSETVLSEEEIKQMNEEK